MRKDIKVYCEDCKFIDLSLQRCFYYEIKPSYLSKKTKQYNVSNCYPKNKDNNCENYKKKWYKFWIQTGEI